MDISIVILNYKSKGFVMNCLKSILEADFDMAGKKLIYEVIVVDNNSDDKLGDILAWQYPQVVFIQNKENLGMGAGNNVGIKKAKGDYVAVMNPDTIAFKDTFQKLYNYMESEKKAGVIGPRQLNPDKSIQNSCYRWPKIFTPIYRRTPLGNLNFAKNDLKRYLMEDFDHKSTQSVDWLLGSFLFIRASAINDVGLFDERYFMYFEDTDYCKRFWEKGWRVVYCASAEIIHNHNRHSAQSEWYNFFTNSLTRRHISSWFKYFIKWRGK
jgi:GT2 family glycosyltransferase